MVVEGPPDAVIARYRSDVAGGEAAGEAGPPPVRVIEEGRRWGNGDVEIVGVTVSSAGNEQRLIPSGSPCTVHIRYRVHRPVDDFVFGVAWQRLDGTAVGGHNTQLDGLRSRRLAADGEVRCDYAALELAPGDYQIDAAVHRADGLAYDYWCDAARVRVTSTVDWPGIWAPNHRWAGDGPEWE
jgi:hypothetical protein